MALHEFSDGIFRTYVTWDEVEKQCQNVFGEDARFGANKTISCIGDGRGFLSKMCLIEPDFPEGVTAPNKIVLKICTQVTMREVTEKMKDMVPDSPFSDPKLLEAMAESVKKLHNVECTLYDLIKKSGNKNLRFPKIYASHKFSEDSPNRGYLIMEFIEGAVNINMYDNVSAKDLKQAMKGIAALEAIGLKFTEEERALFNTNPFVDVFGHIFTAESIKAMVAMFRQFAEPDLKEKVDKFEEYISEITDVPSYLKIGDELGMPQVLAHGDVWSTNILWRQRDGQEGHELLALVDYQTAHMGLPAGDLVRVMGACLSGKERQENWEQLTEDFYGYLLEELNGDEAPYTLEQLKESVKRFFPLGGFLLVPMIGPLFEINNATADEETKAKVRAAIIEKSEALLDDMFAGVDYNRKLKAEKH